MVGDCRRRTAVGGDAGRLATPGVTLSSAGVEYQFKALAGAGQRHLRFLPAGLPAAIAALTRSIKARMFGSFGSLGANKLELVQGIAKPALGCQGLAQEGVCGHEVGVQRQGLAPVFDGARSRSPCNRYAAPRFISILPGLAG